MAEDYNTQRLVSAVEPIARLANAVLDGRVSLVPVDNQWMETEWRIRVAAPSTGGIKYPTEGGQ